ncbi:MAG: hypothetical protein AB2805_18160 [Candidatus Thiodiazotropha sp.]
MLQIDQNDGWNIDADLSLISHSCGFEAEFKGNEVYGIKQFPIEATILDIRNMVSRAEEILSGSYHHQLGRVSSSHPN